MWGRCAHVCPKPPRMLYHTLLMPRRCVPLPESGYIPPSLPPDIRHTMHLSPCGRSVTGLEARLAWSLVAGQHSTIPMTGPPRTCSYCGLPLFPSLQKRMLTP